MIGLSPPYMSRMMPPKVAVATPTAMLGLAPWASAPPAPVTANSTKPTTSRRAHLGSYVGVESFLAIASYTFLAASIVGHTLLIGAVARTVAVLSTATAKPELFLRSSPRHDGEHE